MAWRMIVAGVYWTLIQSCTKCTKEKHRYNRKSSQPCFINLLLDSKWHSRPHSCHLKHEEHPEAKASVAIVRSRLECGSPNERPRPSIDTQACRTQDASCAMLSIQMLPSVPYVAKGFRDGAFCVLSSISRLLSRLESNKLVPSRPTES
jgi:hypothetical protein